MKQNKLKLLRKLPMLLICLMMLPALAAMEEPEENIGSFVVPTPTPVVKEEPADSSGSFFVPTPSPEEPVPTETVLRDIGFILHMEGRLVWENIEIGGSTANAYQYRTKLTQNIVDEYLGECRSLGWTVSEEWLNDGLFAYRLSDSNSLALFLPIYDQGEPLLIVQDSVDFIRYIIDSELNKNEIMITVNGSSSVFPFDQKLKKNLTGHVKYTFAMPEKNYWLGQNYYFRFNGSFDRGGVIVGIPSNAENGKTYRVDYSGKEDPLSFVLNQTTYLRADEIFKEVKSNSAIYTLDKYCYGVATVTMPGISGANDYFQLTVDYLFGNICKCSFEGCFEQGKIRVSGQFWVEE